MSDRAVHATSDLNTCRAVRKRGPRLERAPRGPWALRLPMRQAMPMQPQRPRARRAQRLTCARCWAPAMSS